MNPLYGTLPSTSGAAFVTKLNAAGNALIFSTYLGGASVPTVPGAGYRVVAVADYNGDTHPDLVFQNETSGQLAIWFLAGTAYIGGASLPTRPATGWSVVGPH